MKFLASRKPQMNYELLLSRMNPVEGIFCIWCKFMLEIYFLRQYSLLLDISLFLLVVFIRVRLKY